MRVLLVEDDAMIAQAVKAALTDELYTVEHVADGRDALMMLSVNEYGFVLLDLGLPGLDGMSVLKTFRAHAKETNTPIIIMTARDALQDRLDGLDAGADDYLIKPFDLDELFARIRALLRRSAGRAEPMIERGRLQIKPATHEVIFDGQSVLLSSKEFALLLALAERPGLVLSRAQLEEKLYNWDSSIGSNAIEVHIHHLRKKLSEDAIKTVRGVGYILEC